jgi:uncharacterized protein
MPFDQIVMLLAAAASAGWVDAIIGGGGLIQLPALLIAGVPAASALGTNKLASLAGVSSAAVAYARKIKIEPQLAVPAGALAVVCSGLGAASATAISSAALRPFIMVALVAIAALVALRPAAGLYPQPKLRTRNRKISVIVLTGGVIAYYDGIFGPGTGTFLVLAFTTIIGLDFVHGSAIAKVLNASTNVGALIVFSITGHVLWTLGLAMAVANIAGAQLGAHMTMRHGTKFVRVVLLVVVTVLVAKLGFDQFSGGGS